MQSPHTDLNTFLKSVEYRVARTRAELESVYRIVYTEYLKQGYIHPNDVEMHYSLHNLLPSTTTFVALADDQVITTATVIPDSPLGIPMDELYKKEVDTLRGQKICEISMLTNSSALFSGQASMMLNAKKMFLVFYLFKHMLDYIREYLHLDYICIAINPKHKTTYESLFFKDLGGLKNYDKVNGAPAVAKALNVHTVEQECAKSRKNNTYKLFFSGKTDPERFADKIALSLEDIEYFYLQKKNILDHVTDQQMAYLEKCYPQYDLTQVINHNSTL
jgi:hypothetical protein